VSKRFEDMTLAELHDERDYWQTEISEATGWGAALAAAAEFRDECDAWIDRREREVAALAESN
jgi:hypothetical protein